MRAEDLRRVIRQQPFQRFRIHLTDGTVYEIRHPDMAMVTPSTVLIGVASPGQPGDAIEHVEMVSLLHVVRVEPVLTTVAPAPG
jgi:hypothetical protein